MARQTRQQRRQRRTQQQPALAGGPTTRPAGRPADAGERERGPERRQRRDDARPRGIPGIRFLQESVGELKKVEWPDQKAVVSGTAVVVIACVIVGAYLWANDEIWKYVVQHVLLR